MKSFFYEAEFNNLHIELTKQALHELIKKLMDENFSLYWRYEDDTIFLIIDNDVNLCEIPFSRKGETLILTVDHLTVNDECIVEALEVIISEFSGNGIVKKFSGGPLYITSYRTGLIQSITEIDGSDKTIMNKNGSIIEYRDFGSQLEPQTIINIMNLEIDYTLMELHEAIQEEDEMLINNSKMKLKKLLYKREEVKQFL